MRLISETKDSRGSALDRVSEKENGSSDANRWLHLIRCSALAAVNREQVLRRWVGVCDVNPSHGQASVSERRNL